MAQIVVHRLEVVEVDEQDGKPVVGIAPHACLGLRHPLDEVGAVGQVGERIVQRLVHQLFLGKFRDGLERRGGLLDQPALNQADTHARELEQQPLRPAALDASRRWLWRLTADRRDAPALGLEATRHPAARRPTRCWRQRPDRTQHGLDLGGEGRYVLRGARDDELRSPARVGLPDAHATPVEGKGRPPQDFLPLLLERPREYVCHGCAARRTPPPLDALPARAKGVQPPAPV